MTDPTLQLSGFIVIVTVLRIAAQWLAWRFRLPAILLLTLAAHAVGALSWPVAVLFGAIIVVTGPTVIIPMLRQARLKRRPASLLKWEGIINDPVGALLAVLVFEYFLYEGAGAAVFQVLGGLVAAIAAAAILGIGGGFLLGKAFSHGKVPEFLKAPLAFASTMVKQGYPGGAIC